MSLILDALRRKSTEPEEENESGRPRRAESMLATLGYPRPTSRGTPPLKTLIVYGGAAVAIGFVGLSLVILLLAPSAPKKPAPVVPARTVARGPVSPASPPVSQPVLKPQAAASGQSFFSDFSATKR